MHVMQNVIQVPIQPQFAKAPGGEPPRSLP
jgi:hypothetical protein